LLDGEVIARCRVDDHDAIAATVARVDEVYPAVRLVEVDELRLDLLFVRLPYVRVRRVAFHEQHIRSLLEQVVHRRQRYHRLADAALTAANPVDPP